MALHAFGVWNAVLGTPVIYFRFRIATEFRYLRKFQPVCSADGNEPGYAPGRNGDRANVPEDPTEP